MSIQLLTSAAALGHKDVTQEKAAEIEQLAHDVLRAEAEPKKLGVPSDGFALAQSSPAYRAFSAAEKKLFVRVYNEMLATASSAFGSVANAAIPSSRVATSSQAPSSLSLADQATSLIGILNAQQGEKSTTEAKINVPCAEGPVAITVRSDSSIPGWFSVDILRPREITVETRSGYSYQKTDDMTVSYGYNPENNPSTQVIIIDSVRQRGQDYPAWLFGFDATDLLRQQPLHIKKDNPGIQELYQALGSRAELAPLKQFFDKAIEEALGGGESL